MPRWVYRRVDLYFIPQVGRLSKCALTRGLDSRYLRLACSIEEGSIGGEYEKGTLVPGTGYILCEDGYACNGISSVLDPGSAFLVTLGPRESFPYSLEVLLRPASQATYLPGGPRFWGPRRPTGAQKGGPTTPVNRRGGRGGDQRLASVELGNSRAIIHDCQVSRHVNSSTMRPELY